MAVLSCRKTAERGAGGAWTGGPETPEPTPVTGVEMAAVRTAGRHLNTGQRPGLLASPGPAGWWDSTPGSRCTPQGEDGPPRPEAALPPTKAAASWGHVNPSSARPATLISREPPGSEPRTQGALEDPGNFNSPVPTGSPAHSESEIPKVVQTWNSPGLASLIAVDSGCGSGNPKGPQNLTCTRGQSPLPLRIILSSDRPSRRERQPLARPVSGAERRE